jgi:short-subunit dehydrogenase
MNEYYKDKVVLVTGGTDGIGKALVNLLLSYGAKVATCGRNQERLYDLQAAHPSAPLHTIIADVSAEKDCKKFIESSVNVFGGIDILINNAGISMRGLFKELDLDVFKKVMDINLFGAVYCTRYALPHIIKNKGAVVGVSSVAGYRGLPGRTAYSASKFAMQGFLEALRVELMDDKVHVMWVAPGFTSSGIRDRALNEKGDKQEKNPMDENKMMSAEVCATNILKALAGKKRVLTLTFTTKETIFLDTVFPALTDKLIHKFYFKNGKLVK